MKISKVEDIDNLKVILSQLAGIVDLDMMICITDRDRFLFYNKGRTIDVNAVVGERIPEGDPLRACMGMNKKLLAMVPKEVYGYAFKAICTPMTDAENQIIGSIGVGISVEREQKLATMSANLAAISEEITASINEISSNANEISKDNNILFEELAKVEDYVKSTSTMLDYIKNISQQSNMLSLNAAIEAARAGEAGRGFAVVANEMKTLADKTKGYAKEISEIINSINLSMGNSKMLSDKTYKSALIQSQNTGEILASIEELSSSAQELAHNADISKEFSN